MKDIIQLPLFKDFDGYSPKYHFFKNLLLGKIHDSIPWDALVSCLLEERSGRGAPCWFGTKGMFVLMFLKAYLNIYLSTSILSQAIIFSFGFWQIPYISY